MCCLDYSSPAVELLSVLSPRSRKELLLLPLHVVLVTGLLILCLFYLKPVRFQVCMYCQATCLTQDQLLRGTWEMRSDSFCSYTASVASVKSANKNEEFNTHAVTGSPFELKVSSSVTKLFCCSSILMKASNSYTWLIELFLHTR